MKHTILLLSFILISVSAYAAEEIPTGDWLGSVTMHNETKQQAKYKVKKKGRDFKVTMFFNDRPYKFIDLEQDEEKMLFALDTGIVYQCKLNKLSDGGFKGSCIHEDDEEQRKIKITMQPPQIPDDELLADNNDN